MKNRRLKLLSAVIVAILLLTAFFVSCDKKPPQPAHTHEFKEVGGAAKKCDCGETLAYTDEENFAYWNVGRKHSLNYDGAYTSAATGTSTETSGKDVSSYADAVLETADGNKLLRTNRTHAIGADGKTDESKVTEGDDICIKIVDDNGVSRNKKVRVEYDNGEVTRKGSWVRPTKASEETLHYSPKRLCAELVDFDDSSFAKFIGEAKAFYVAQAAADVTITIVRNDDNSVSLKATLAADEKNPNYTSDKDYIKTTIEMGYEIVVKEGKIVYRVDDYAVHELFSVENKNTVYIRKQTTEIAYTFDEVAYAAFDMSTDTTENNYTSLLKCYINGYYYGYLTFPLAGEPYSKEQATADFAAAYIIERHFHDESVEYKDLYTLYSDAEMTTPFEGFDAIEEHATIYVRLNLPENLSMAICLYEENGETRFKCAMVCDNGGNFTAGNQGDGVYSMLPGYNCVSVDGVALDEPGATKFTMEAGKTYIVVVKYAGN